MSTTSHTVRLKLAELETRKQDRILKIASHVILVANHRVKTAGADEILGAVTDHVSNNQEAYIGGAVGAAGGAAVGAATGSKGKRVGRAILGAILGGGAGAGAGYMMGGSEDDPQGPIDTRFNPRTGSGGVTSVGGSGGTKQGPGNTRSMPLPPVSPPTWGVTADPYGAKSDFGKPKIKTPARSSPSTAAMRDNKADSSKRRPQLQDGKRVSKKDMNQSAVTQRSKEISAHREAFGDGSEVSRYQGNIPVSVPKEDSHDYRSIPTSATAWERLRGLLSGMREGIVGQF